MVTQRAIATALNLSTATVSRSLRNRGHHDEKTRTAVLEAAAKLGYRLPRRTLPVPDVEMGERHPIGVSLSVAHDDVPEVALRILHGISDAARTAGRMLNIDYVEPGPSSVPALAAGASPLAGVIFIQDIPAATKGILSDRCPGVQIALRDPGITLDGIGQDDLAATHDLVGLLYSLGHRRIGFVGQSHAGSFASARTAAYVQALLQRNLPISSTSLVNGVSSDMIDDETVELVVADINRGTRAWIGIHDACAYRLIRALRSRGLSVPAEVSVCGYDHLRTPDDCPALTTIDWPFEDIGAEAVKRLLQRTEHPSEAVRQVILPGRLVVRSTTAAPRA